MCEVNQYAREGSSEMMEAAAVLYSLKFRKPESLDDDETNEEMKDSPPSLSLPLPCEPCDLPLPELPSPTNSDVDMDDEIEPEEIQRPLPNFLRKSTPQRPNLTRHKSNSPTAVVFNWNLDLVRENLQSVQRVPTIQSAPSPDNITNGANTSLPTSPKPPKPLQSPPTLSSPIVSFKREPSPLPLDAPIMPPPPRIAVVPVVPRDVLEGLGKIDVPPVSGSQLLEKQSRRQKWFQCKKCDLKFMYQTHFLIHKREHNEQTLYACKLCRKQFAWASALEVHMRTHTGDKPFKCRICGKGFVQRAGLENHTRIHTGERPYKCLYPGCGRAFTQQGALKRHQSKHTGEKRFPCNYCPKRFARKDSRDTHVRAVHKMNPPLSETQQMKLEERIHAQRVLAAKAEQKRIL